MIEIKKVAFPPFGKGGKDTGKLNCEDADESDPERVSVYRIMLNHTDGEVSREIPRIVGKFRRCTHGHRLAVGSGQFSASFNMDFSAITRYEIFGQIVDANFLCFQSICTQ
jgi:hypothetical protein